MVTYTLLDAVMRSIQQLLSNMSWKLFSHDMSLSPEIYFRACVECLSKLVGFVLIEIIEKKLRQYKWNSAETVSQNCFSKAFYHLVSP